MIMDVEEIRNEIEALCERLDLDPDIVERVNQDIAYCDNLYIIEIDSDGNLGRLFPKVTAVKSKSEFPSHITSMDCIVAISKSGDDPDSIKLVRYAKSKGGLVYVISPNPKGELALLADQFILIKETPHFEDNVRSFLLTVSDRIQYYIESEEYLIDSSHPLDIGEYHRREKIKRVSETTYESPFLKRQHDKRANAFERAFSIKNIIIIMIVSYVISYAITLFISINQMAVFILIALALFAINGYRTMKSRMNDSP